MSEPKPMLTADVLAIVTARAEKAEAELAELRKAAGIKSDERVTQGFEDGSMRVVTTTGTVRRVWPGSGAGEAELAAALEELAATKCVDELLHAAMNHLAAAQKREAKLRELCSKHESMWKYQVLRILDKDS